MKLLSAVMALLPLATASLHLRQDTDSAVQVTDLNAVGPGCPAHGVRKDLKTNGTEDATVEFDTYESVLRAGAGDAQRDVHCQVFVTLKFPAGCTSATLSTTYRGRATVADGATGALAPSYRLQGGQLDVTIPEPTFFEGAEYKGGKDYERTDEVVAKVDGEKEGEVQFVIRSRTFVQTTNGEGAGEGSVTSDDISVSVKSSEGC